MPNQCLICESLDFKQFDQAKPYNTVLAGALTLQIMPMKLLYYWVENAVIQHTFLQFDQSKKADLQQKIQNSR